ncbi:MAG: TolC family protein [Candidatus Omnitrophica bacterium]|nr:TolC family protein [Candidatus Omnitrophota bacterium]
MSRNIRILFFSFIFLSQFLIPPIRAEETGEALSLKETLSLAYDHNPQMIEAQKTIRAAQGDLITTRTLLNPELEAEIGGLKKNEEGERKGHLETVSIVQPFEPFGVRELKTKIAKNEVKIGEESLKAVWSNIYSQVRSGYMKIILDKKELELAQDNLSTMRQLFSNVQIRFQSGQGFKNDLQRAKIEMLRAENEYLIAEKEIKIDKGKLNLLLGRSLDIPFDIKEELKVEDLKLDLQKLMALAFKRPDLKIEKLKVDSKNKNLMKEQLNRLPSFSLGFQKTNADYDNDYAALVSVSVPLWNLNQGEVKKAKAEKEIQEARLDVVEKEIGFDVYQAYLNAEVSQKQVEFLKESVEEANELIRLADLNYREGEIDFINYRDQVKTATETKVRYYEGIFNLDQSISELERAIYGSLREGEFLK